MESHDVIIIGAGPAGLAAAISLRERGVKDVVVLERERQAGGIPRHCGHFGFGWESHRTLMTGPNLAKAMLKAAEGIDIRTNTTVLEFNLRQSLRVHSAKGVSELSAKHIILATGTREQPRSARFIGGNRFEGILNTGTLQQLVYLKNQKPFSYPVIIGNEWVTYSALMTCKHAGIKPAGIFCEETKLQTPWYFPPAAKLRYGVTTYRAHKLLGVFGNNKIETATFDCKGKIISVKCDGVILSGRFVPETDLITSRNTSVTRVGNVNGTVNTAGRCIVDAKSAAEQIARALL